MSLSADLLAAITATDADVAVEPPGHGDGFWAGGPSIAHLDGVFWLAYRLRRPVTEGRGYANVVARSEDGVRFEPVATVPVGLFGAASLERPALVPRPDGGWRLYVSCSTLDSKHWWVEALDADEPAGLPSGRRSMVLPGDLATTAWKDVVVRHTDAHGWQMWACRHPLDGGDAEADRMTSVYFTSDDGLAWTEVGTALAPTAGSWDARGTRITTVVQDGDGWLACYDGRATAAENWYERTGFATGSSPASFTAAGGPTPAGRTLRYLSVADLGDAYRVYWEASRPDGANDLRTAYVPRSESPSQS
ncbi:MAG: hypothetical protein ACTHMS_15340 [Jatrophihabitans sp.]|uniref:hypothetical protein n=1 Tax=Jatrophihabitans sp. TaxID=1932789 RepID=UPI003F7E49B2